MLLEVHIRTYSRIWRKRNIILLVKREKIFQIDTILGYSTDGHYWRMCQFLPQVKLHIPLRVE